MPSPLPKDHLGYWIWGFLTPQVPEAGSLVASPARDDLLHPGSAPGAHVTPPSRDLVGQNPEPGLKHPAGVCSKGTCGHGLSWATLAGPGSPVP